MAAGRGILPGPEPVFPVRPTMLLTLSLSSCPWSDPLLLAVNQSKVCLLRDTISSMSWCCCMSRDAEFSELECKLTAEQITMYDGAVQLWQVLMAATSHTHLYHQALPCGQLGMLTATLISCHKAYIQSTLVT